MEVNIRNHEVVIAAAGMEFLKLKTEIYKRLGTLSFAKNNEIMFPASSLSLVEDLLNEDARNVPAVKDYLDFFKIHETARQQALTTVEQGLHTGVTDEWLNILDPAQASAVASMVTPGILGLCLFDEQGSGKTVMSIAAFDLLKEKGIVDALIVVCPKSMVSEWPKDIDRFLPSKYKLIQAEGDKRQKYEASLSAFDVLVTNYEGIDVMRTSLLATASKTRFLLIVDESYYLKNGNSVRSENISKLRGSCARCFVLCGTPAPNSAHDLINQFDIADLGFTFGGYVKSNDPAQDWDKISELVEKKGLFIRRLKTEILKHVPEKDFHVIRIPLSGRQAKMYEKAKTDLVLELKTLDNERFRKNLITYFQRRAALLQICCCPNNIDPTFNDTPVKYIPCDELVNRLTNEGRKVIIWSFYKKSIDELMSRYSHLNPARVDGSVPTSARRLAVKSFQENPQTLLFIGNPAAAGAGITLHSSYDAIYMSYSNQAAHYLQSLDRIHRRGQNSDHVNYYLLACEGTVEETEISRLRGKEIRQHNLLGDHIPWPTSLDDALQELAT